MSLHLQHGEQIWMISSNLEQDWLGPSVGGGGIMRRLVDAAYIAVIKAYAPDN